MRNPALTAVLGSLIAVLFFSCAGASVAATYQLQVASVPEHVFMYFVRGNTLPGIEDYLDDTRRSKFVLFHDRSPQMIEPTAGHVLPPAPDSVRPSKANHPWAVTTWEGEAGQLVVFRIRGNPNNHQKLRRVAVHTNDVLTRFPVRGIPASGSRRMQTPSAPASVLAHALRNGTFAGWVERHAEAYDGLSVIIGRDHGQQLDTVYLVVRIPQTGREYKVVLGWEDLNQRGVIGNGQGSKS